VYKLKPWEAVHRPSDPSAQIEYLSHAVTVLRINFINPRSLAQFDLFDHKKVAVNFPRL
jgi:hypothetical protein